MLCKHDDSPSCGTVRALCTGPRDTSRRASRPSSSARRTGLADGAPAPDARLSALANREALGGARALRRSSRPSPAPAQPPRRTPAAGGARHRTPARARPRHRDPTLAGDDAATDRDAPPEALRRGLAGAGRSPARGALPARGARGDRRARARDPPQPPPRHGGAAPRGGAPAGARANLARADGARRATYGSRTSGGEPRVRDAGEAEHDRVTQPPREPHERAGRRARGAGEGRRAQVEATDAELLAGRGSRRPVGRSAPPVAAPREAADVPPTSTASPSLAPVQAPTGSRTLVVDAVAYHLPGNTASGLPVGVGVVAVDPSVIPLGTQLFVPGYGPAVAADIGSAIKGTIIDLWMPTTAAAQAWGRHTVTITVYG